MISWECKEGESNSWQVHGKKDTWTLKSRRHCDAWQNCGVSKGDMKQAMFDYSRSRMAGGVLLGTIS